MGLILISLPALISLILIDFIVRVKQKRHGSAIRGCAMFFGFVPSIVSLGIFIWPYAPWAIWSFLVSEVSGARPESKI